MVEVRGVVKGYGEGPVLRGVDLTIEPGKFYAILGPSGSGKSTLLNLLGLMDRPDEGEISFSGKATRDLSEEARCRLRNESLGFVFQFDSLLPEFTVLENVTMPARLAGKDASPRAKSLLEGLGLGRLLERLPNQLSGGERQRAALCRALLNKPAVVLADEPTGNLDKAATELVFGDLKALCRDQGAAVVMVTHNEAACALADRVLRMQDGRLA